LAYRLIVSDQAEQDFALILRFLAESYMAFGELAADAIDKAEACRVDTRQLGSA
jgi:hypothetical protein